MKSKHYTDYLNNSPDPLLEKNRFDKEMALTFHENTKRFGCTDLYMNRRSATYLHDLDMIYMASTNYKNYVTKDIKKLPEPRPLEGNLSDTFNKRKSCREFVADTMGLQDLSDILSSIRVTRHEKPLRDFSDSGLDPIMLKRPYSSAGGLYPIESYVLLPHESGTHWSLHHYNPDAHGLVELQGALSNEAVADTFNDVMNTMEGVAAVIVMTAMLERSTDKYGAIGYRFSMIEGGALMQNISLAAEDRDFGTLQFAGFYEDRLDRLLGLDGVAETTVLTQLIGRRKTGG